MTIDEIEASFTGERLLRAVCDQALVDENSDLAFALIDAGEKLARPDGSVLYEKGDSTKGIYLILHGSIEVGVDEQPLAVLPAGEAVGSWPVLYSDPEYKGRLKVLCSPEAECIDADGEPLTTDQRGVERPQGDACDVGAVEMEVTP